MILVIKFLTAVIAIPNKYFIKFNITICLMLIIGHKNKIIRLMH